MERNGNYPLVYIEWEDSMAGTSGWCETAGVQPSVNVIRSVGWLIYDGKDCKMVVPHLSEPDHATAKEQGCGDMTIPASAVRKVVKLKIRSKA